MRKIFLVSVLLHTLLSSAQTWARPDLQLVKDINHIDSGSDPESFVRLGDIVVFTMNDSVHGRQIWKTQGTEATTARVAQIDHEPIDEEYAPPPIDLLTTAGNFVFFRVKQPSDQWELWRTDGSESGTILLANVPVYGTPVAFNNMLFFAVGGANGGLWRSDGTPTGTENICPGSIEEIGATETALFFERGMELWKSDGTASGTSILLPFSVCQTPHEFLAKGNIMYFTGYDNAHGHEIWVSDGTSEGTHLVKDVEDGPGSAGASQKAIVGDKIFFSADHSSTGKELWVSDRTDAGTYLVKDAVPGVNGITPLAITSYNNLAIYSAYTVNEGRQIWRSDGTPGGTYMLKHSCPKQVSAKVLCWALALV